jgi:hypothetical protein
MEMNLNLLFKHLGPQELIIKDLHTRILIIIVQMEILLKILAAPISLGAFN